MSDFTSFEQISQFFVSAESEFKGEGFKREQRRAGRQLVDKFRNRILDGGPGWRGLKESTQEERSRLGYEPDLPLNLTGQMFKAIAYEVNGDDIQVGIVDGEYQPPEGAGASTMNKAPISLYDLFMLHEMGSREVEGGVTRYMPARPIFTDEYATKILEDQAQEFGERVSKQIMRKMRKR